jgi:hypothetical protein
MDDIETAENSEGVKVNDGEVEMAITKAKG